jgi:hypothetical protein
MSPDKLNKRKDFMISILGFLDLSSQLLLHFYLLFGQILFAGLRGGFDG